jgi:nitroreductase
MNTNGIIAPADLEGRLNWRYATKQFEPGRAIPDEVWQALERALVLAPSSFGLQPWKFIVVNDPALRAKLLPHSWNQRQIVDASRLVVFTVKDELLPDDVHRLIARTAESRGVAPESLAAYRDIILGFIAGRPTRDWSSRQVYVALGQFMTAAAVLGIDTCPMEGIDAAVYDEILGLAGTGYSTLCACAAGYRAETDKYAKLPKVRYSDAEIVEHR